MARMRSKIDRLVRNAAVVVGGSVLILLGTLVYLILALRAAQAAGPDVMLFATLAAALTAASCGALAPLVRSNRLLRQEIARLEQRVEELADAQWELREQEERARGFVELMSDVIVRRDAAGRIGFANDAYCRLVRLSSAELVGHAFTPLVLEQGPVAVLDEGTRTHDQKIASPDGPRWIAWREVAVRAGAGTETLSVGRDVTDRVTAERALAEARDQAEAANRAKSRFLATVSHEIRTPLNGILGMTDLLLDTPLTPAQTTYAEAVQASGRALLVLIEDILDFAKIESGRVEVAAKPFDLAAVIEETVELLAPRAHGKAIEIAAFVDPGLPARVIGDAARLRQILLNLAGNAVKFTEAGGITVTAEPGPRDGTVALTVQDTGIGIAADAMERIFGEFEQADAGTDRRFGGTGLGLAITRRIVARLDGSIAVDSAPGAGASFRVELPLPAADPAVQPTAPAARPDLAGRSVLVVTADPRTVEALRRQLAAWGARTLLAGPDDPAATAAPDCDAVLVDHAIGPAAAARLAGCPVARRIVMLRPGERGALAGLEAAGFTGYLIKPVRAASLAERLGVAGAPAAALPGTPLAAPVSRPQAPRAVPYTRAVLVAEDNEINALLVRVLLERLGHRVTVTSDGTAAVTAWQRALADRRPFDVVLMDLHMPGLDGLAATRCLRFLEAELGVPPALIAALTADASPADPETYAGAGLDAVLTKPLDRDRLEALLASHSGRGALAA
ncbi:ATP-binding protein [Rhodoplanes sp. TEM]|uniref:histidine kinase n=1 Tax=Rhodoplanes tepidamans TaxID=200616 RepID=A0ABT5J3F0_RHOTP|nr:MULTISPECIES: ATP-binding protein [Rhodoplanes]MDC7784163.1 ATP-binding protein [Rhodoplanes tepidamans]MDC7983258.1 ATP-binding protein [Rhodoplanes sp. TEM]MDQ0356739.1 PAS domain S-box-containing protein [Rhodoplanes tepidamans]